MSSTRSIRQRAENVTCNECGEEGNVDLLRLNTRTGAVNLIDHIPHAEGCSLYKRPQPKHLKKKAWVGQEKRANKLTGARETLMSGAVGEDGDGRLLHEWRIECKQTIRERYLLKQTVWEKLVKGAVLAGEEPVLHVEIRGGEHVRRTVVVLRTLYDALMDAKPNEVNASKKTYFVGMWQTPALVPLDPPGVELMEAEFTKLKEKLDEQRRSDLPGSAG